MSGCHCHPPAACSMSEECYCAWYRSCFLSLSWWAGIIFQHVSLSYILPNISYISLSYSSTFPFLELFLEGIPARFPSLSSLPWAHERASYWALIFWAGIILSSSILSGHHIERFYIERASYWALLFWAGIILSSSILSGHHIELFYFERASYWALLFWAGIILSSSILSGHHIERFYIERASYWALLYWAGIILSSSILSGHHIELFYIERASYWAHERAMSGHHIPARFPSLSSLPWALSWGDDTAFWGMNESLFFWKPPRQPTVGNY